MPASSPRERHFSVWSTTALRAETLTALRALAADRGLTVSALIRGLILDALARAAKP